ncbi:MAG TPA: hypothetical protein PKM25_13425, partial [Candidatus Ozemobacteraceae bacterium]|nr:hypothetical protein [Candidatus Ozemobacteraceae bacterium]
VFVLPVVGAGAPPAARGGCATVDTRLLLILHPRLANFDYAQGRLFRADVAQRPREQIQKELAACWEKAASVIAGISTKRSRILEQRAQILQRWDETMNSMYANAASGSSQLRDHDKSMQEFDARFRAELTGCEAALERIETEKILAQESALGPIYLSSQETEREVTLAKNEISQLIAQTAQENQVAMVLDSTFGVTAVCLDSQIACIPRQSTSFDTTTTSLFQQFTNWEAIPSGQIPLADGTKVDAATHLAPQRMKNMIDMMQQQLEVRPYIPTGLAQFSPGNLFLYGGVDLTAAVARKMFTQYRIPEELKNSYMLFIRDYAAFEQNRSRLSQDPNALPPVPGAPAQR